MNSKTRKLIIFFIIINLLAHSYEDHMYWGNPQDISDTLYLEENGIVLDREGYALYFNYNRNVPLWVNYCLEKEDVIKNDSSAARLGYFLMDPDIKSYLYGKKEPKSSDYKIDLIKNKNFYDRGHMVPAADMIRSKKVMRESFYITNICPQIPAFNRQIWKKLENEVRELVKKEKQLWVTTGPIFMGDTCIEKLGECEIWVPTHFYKIITYYKPTLKNSKLTINLKIIGFLMPNKKCEKELKDYIVPIDSIEILSGFDFFNILPDRLEDKLESKVFKF